MYTKTNVDSLVVDELARALHEPEVARELVLRAGFPPGSLPSFRVPNAFWSRVLRDADAGMVGRGALAILREVAARFPDNEIFAKYRAAARVFISCRTKNESLRAFSNRLITTLRERSHQIFADPETNAGQSWAESLRRGILEADVLILLLTSDSAVSEVVLREVEIARESASRNNGRPRIIPVRLAFVGELPYPMNNLVDPLKQFYWREQSDDAETIEALAQAVAGNPSAEEKLLPQTENDEASRQPTPSARIPVRLPPPGGALDIEDPLYIQRSTDEEALRVIRQDGGQTISIKGPRQVGKSSLLMRVLAAALESGRHAVLLDFQLFSGAADSATAFFRHFIREVTEQLDLQRISDDDWDPYSTPAQSCTRLFERRVLRPLDKPLTLACDEADLISGLPFRSDFFGMLRAWHNKRANPMQRKIWRRLDLVLATSTEPYLFIDRHDQSPFNVGAILSLTDFSPEQIARLNRMHDTPLDSEGTQQLHELTNGQAFLVRKALYAVSQRGLGIAPPVFFRQAIDDEGPFGDHLRRHLLNLLENPTLVPVMSAIVSGRGTDNESAVQRLVGAGLVKRQGQRVVPRCELYRNFFQQRLTNSG